MNHTPESLLALTKSPEGLEKMRIIAAQFDGWEKLYKGTEPDNRFMHGGQYKTTSDIPNYPTSLDAIFAAEERLGLHKQGEWGLQERWLYEASLIFFIEHGVMPEGCELPHFTKIQRVITFILTAQWKEQNQ